MNIIASLAHELLAMDAPSCQLVRVTAALADMLRMVGLDHSHVTSQVTAIRLVPRRHFAR